MGEDMAAASPATVKFKTATERKRLNKRTISSLSPPAEVNGRPKQRWVYDETTARLAICIWSTGAVSWFWVGKLNGRLLRMKLGAFPEISPEQARKLAAGVSAKVSEGIDPRAERRRLRDELTLGELFTKYIEEHAKLHKKTWREDEQQFNRYLKRLKSRPVSAITRDDVVTLHRRVGKDAPYAANRLLALISKVFSFAETEVGYVGGNPAKGMKRFKERSRERFLKADELQRLFAALEAEPDLFRDFFKLLLFTGARRANVMAMRFEDVDFVDATWTIPDTKSGDSQTVHLPADALEILQTRRETIDGEYVFPARRGKEPHMTDPKAAWDRVRERAGLPDVRMHDLRRTLGSWQAATGASLPVIGKSLGHKSTAVTQVYARLDLDPVRLSVNTAVAAMTLAAKGGNHGS